MLRESYSAEEWRTLQFAPLWVYVTVAAIDGKIDDKESAAFVKELSEWAQFKEPLVQEVLLSVVKELSGLMTEYKADPRDIMVGLKDVADLLDLKASPEQAKNFKGAMLLIGRNIAEASGVGMFGTGDKTSKDESAALVLVMMTLRANL